MCTNAMLPVGHVIERLILQAVVQFFLESGRPPPELSALESDSEPESEVKPGPRPEAQPALYNLWQPVKKGKVQAS